jgi:sortase A
MKSVGCRAVQPRGKRATMFRAASYVFLIVGLLALGYSVYAVVDARAYQTYEQAKFESKLETGKRQPPPPLIVEGSIIGEIQVSRLHLKAIVVQGDSNTILRRAVGHVPETALPGEPGNVALAGHRDTFFRALRNIRRGDAITLKTSDRDFEYVVDSMAVVASSEVGVLSASSAYTLTLITCFPFDYIGFAPNRFVVRAHEVLLPSAEPHAAPQDDSLE